MLMVIQVRLYSYTFRQNNQSLLKPNYSQIISQLLFTTYMTWDKGTTIFPRNTHRNSFDWKLLELHPCTKKIFFLGAICPAEDVFQLMDGSRNNVCHRFFFFQRFSCISCAFSSFVPKHANGLGSEWIWTFCFLESWKETSTR